MTLADKVKLDRPDQQVNAAILLAGGISPSPLTRATGLSVLDLLLTCESTVLDHWMRVLRVLCHGHADFNMPIIVTAGGAVPAPDLSLDRGKIDLVADPRSYRGAAGVVKDVTDGMSDDALLLVVEAARYLNCDLSEMAHDFVESRSDVFVAANPDRSPAGIYLFRRGLLNLVQHEGYMDLKEQWLNRVVSDHHRVGVYQLKKGFSYPLRTREQMLHAAQLASGQHSSNATPYRFAQTGESSSKFQCISRDAKVDDTAVIIDSILMPGAEVGPSCIVSRSIICADSVVTSNTRVVDDILSSSSINHTASEQQTAHAGKTLK